MSEIELSVGVVVIVLVKELDVAVVDQLSYHRHVGPVHGAFPLQHDRRTERRENIRDY